MYKMLLVCYPACHSDPLIIYPLNFLKLITGNTALATIIMWDTEWMQRGGTHNIMYDTRMQFMQALHVHTSVYFLHSYIQAACSHTSLMH